MLVRFQHTEDGLEFIELPRFQNNACSVPTKASCPMDGRHFRVSKQCLFGSNKSGPVVKLKAIEFQNNACSVPTLEKRLEK